LFKKIIQKLKSPAILYTLSSLIYSFSTNMVLLFVPYKLNLESMAQFTAILNISFMLSFVFEFGVVTSFLRFNQLYGITKYINAYMQIIVFFLMFIAATTLLGYPIDKFLGIDSLNIGKEYVYLVAFAVLSWVFFKNIFLSNKKTEFIFFNALILTVIRVVVLVVIMINSNKFSMQELYLYLFILPFIVVMFFNLKNIFDYFIDSLKYISNKGVRGVFLKKFKTISFFAITTYMISILFVYASRYPVIYLTKESVTKTLAEIGYATTIGGMIIIFSVSIRSYFISKFNISNTDEIKKYINKMFSYRYKFLLITLLFATLVSAIIYFIKPNYLSFDTVVYVFILVVSYAFSSYLGMFSLLSKTFNFNKLELILNVIRLLLVIFWTNIFLKEHPIAGYTGLNFSMVVVEFIFAKIVLNRVAQKR